MRQSLHWVMRLLRSDERRDVLALLTPVAARRQPLVVRLAVAGVTAVGLAMAGGVALLSMAALMAAIGIMYFLATQVLGLQINVDPAALYQQMQRQAQQATASYGPN